MINLNSMLINVIQVGNHVIAGTRRPADFHALLHECSTVSRNIDPEVNNVLSNVERDIRRKRLTVSPHTLEILSYLLGKINPAVQTLPDTPPESTFHVPVSYFNVFHNLSDDLKTDS